MTFFFLFVYMFEHNWTFTIGIPLTTWGIFFSSLKIFPSKCYWQQRYYITWDIFKPQTGKYFEQCFFNETLQALQSLSAYCCNDGKPIFLKDALKSLWKLLENKTKVLNFPFPREKIMKYIVSIKDVSNLKKKFSQGLLEQ